MEYGDEVREMAQKLAEQAAAQKWVAKHAVAESAVNSAYMGNIAFAQDAYADQLTREKALNAAINTKSEGEDGESIIARAKAFLTFLSGLEGAK